MNDYLVTTLRGQELSFIARPMNSACKAAVLIPAFDESIDMLTRVLESLAQQKALNKGQFEVNFIISNNKKHALKRTKEFLQNQKGIRFLQFLNGQIKTCPFALSKAQKQSVKKIQKNRLVVNVIDKSSKRFAEKHDNANAARNRAGAEICHRFLSVPAGVNGIIAMTDCDCRFSKNYIAELIRTFEIPEVNLVAGKWLLERDKGLPYSELIEQTIPLPEKKLLKHHQNPKQKMPLHFFRPDKKDKPMPMGGQNLAVRVGSWLTVGGIPQRFSFDDLVFAHNVSQLPGVSVYNQNFWVSTLLRVSERTGIISLGRRVKIVSDSINNFVNGRSQEIYIPRWREHVGIATPLKQYWERGILTEKNLRIILTNFNFDLTNINPKAVEKLVELLNKGFGSDFSLVDARAIEQLVLKDFYPHLPKIIIRQN